MRYFEKRIREEKLTDVNIKTYLERQKLPSNETGSSIEARGTLDTKLFGRRLVCIVLRK